MAVSITYPHSREFPADIQDLEVGMTGYRHAMVQGVAELSEVMALLPAKGEPWSPSLPDLKVRRRGPITRVGGVARDDGNGGIMGVVWKARIDYATDGIEVLPIGVERTEIISGAASQTVLFGLDDPGPGETKEKLNNGRGLSINVPRSEAVYYAYPSESDFEAIIHQALAARCTTNAAQIVLPDVAQTSQSLTLEAGQALYLDFTTRNERGIFEVAWRMEIGPNFLARWELEDEDGNGTGEIRTARVYDSSSFAFMFA